MTMTSWLFRHNSKKSINGPKYRAQRMRRFSSSEGEVLAQWSLLPTLFDDWDIDGSGSIDQKELLLGIETFCKSNRIYFSRKNFYEVLHQVDVNHDCELDRREFVAFLEEFSRSINVALFDVVYFMMDFLADRDNWEIDDGSQSGVLSLAKSISFRGNTIGSVWDKVQLNLEQEL